MQRGYGLAAVIVAALAGTTPALADGGDLHVVAMTALPAASAAWQRIDAYTWYRTGQPSAAMLWRRVDEHHWTLLPQAVAAL